MTTAFVGIGSNLNCPSNQVRGAVPLLGQLPHTRLSAVSSLYQSAPVGVDPQPDFVNAVANLDTELAPFTLLKLLLQLESNFGRVRQPNVMGAARTLDLDLLLYGRQIIESDTLLIPHPRLHQRRFVLLPLMELSPDMEIPRYGAITHLVRDTVAQRVEKIADSVSK